MEKFTVRKNLFIISILVVVISAAFFVFKNQIISKIFPDFVPPKVFKVGVLQFVSAKATDDYIKGALDAISEAGFIEGKNIIYFKDKSPNGDRQKAAGVIQKFIDRKVDLILVTNTVGTQEAVKLTKDIPIVFLGVADPLNTSLVKSLAGSGTNIAGVTAFPPIDKTFEYAKGVFPNLKKMGIIYATTDPAAVALAKRSSEVAKSLNIELLEGKVTSRDQVVAEAENLLDKNVEVLYIPPDTVVVPATKDVQELASLKGVPLVGNVTKDFSIINMNVDFIESGNLGGKIAAKILKGMSPGVIPMENPNRFFLTVNLKAAKEAGVTIPESVLSLANELITEEGVAKELITPKNR